MTDHPGITPSPMEKTVMTVEHVLHVRFRVVAYDCSGYGDDCSREFTDGDEAVDYAKSLSTNFGAQVWKTITMDTIQERVL